MGREHAQAHLADYAGIFQADPSADTTGCTRLTESGQIVEAACWAMPGDPFSRWPISLPPPAAERKANTGGDLACGAEASGALMRCSRSKRSINGQSAERRRAVRQD